MSGFKGTQRHIPPVEMISNHNALSEALFVQVCITATTLCLETFRNKEVRLLIKAGSTDGLAGS